MRGIKRIISLMFLGLFGFLNLHNVIPHTHHSHDDKTHQESHHHRSHDHDHNSGHGEDHDSENQDLGFFLHLFAHHTHTSHIQETVDCVSKSQKESETRTHQITQPENESYLGFIEENIHRYSVFKQALSDKNHLDTNPHRGPPSLG